MTLPKIHYNLMNTNLTTMEKIDYTKARCTISACLHAESGSVIFSKEQGAIETLNRLNNKIEEGT